MSEYKIIDHKVIDESTGEILGDVVTDGIISDKYAFEAVSEKLSRIDSEIDSETRRLEAMIENQRKLLARKKSYRDYLLACYTEPLKSYCLDQAERYGNSTIRNLYATYSFRNVKGGLKLVDEEAALDAAKTFRGLKLKDCIKTTCKFQVSKLTEKQKQLIIKKGVPGFEVSEDEKRFYIKTAGSGSGNDNA
jgi:hypothetical protein